MEVSEKTNKPVFELYKDKPSTSKGMEIGFLLDTAGDREESETTQPSDIQNAFTRPSSKASHFEELRKFAEELMSNSNPQGSWRKTAIEIYRDKETTEKGNPQELKKQSQNNNAKRAKEETSTGFLLDAIGNKDECQSVDIHNELKKFTDSLLKESNQLKQAAVAVFRDDGSTKKKPQLTKKQPQRKRVSTVTEADIKPRKLSAEAQKALKKAVVTPDFEQLKTVPRYELSKRKLQQERKKEREKTKGKGWYGLPATEMTDEVKKDLEVLQMRSVLDPKHFYKKNDLKVLPKYFQIGKVMDSPLDFYNNRLTKKERKKTLVDELLADAEFQQYNKRKYKEVMEEKQKTHYKSWRKAKSLKKKKK